MTKWPLPEREPARLIDKPCPHCGGEGQEPNPAWLRWKRQRAGLTLRAFARTVTCAPSFLCDVEHGRRHASPGLVRLYEELPL